MFEIKGPCAGRWLGCAAISAPWPEPAAPAGLRERLAAAAALGVPAAAWPARGRLLACPAPHPRARSEALEVPKSAHAPGFFWPFLLWSLTGNTAVVEDVSHAYVAFINKECVLWITAFWRGNWEFRLTIPVSQLLLEWGFCLNQEICRPPRCSCPWWFLYSVARTPLLCWFPWAAVHVNI